MTRLLPRSSPRGLRRPPKVTWAPGRRTAHPYGAKRIRGLKAATGNYASLMHTARRSRKVWLFLLTLGFIGLFVESSLAASGESHPKPFDGWVTVLTTSNDLQSKHQYRLQVDSLGDGERPAISYTVSVCGAGESTGWLLVGGDARLDDAVDTSADQRLQIVPTMRLALASDEVVNLGTVQVMRFKVERPPSCVAPVGAAQEAFLGAGFKVQGHAQAPMLTTQQFWPFLAPRQINALPMTGDIKGIAHGNGGVFKSDELSSNSLIVPPALTSVVDAGELSVSALIESSRPSASAEPGVSWTSHSGVHPIAAYVEPGEVARLTTWANGSALLAGIFGGLLVSTLLDGSTPTVAQRKRPRDLPDEPVPPPSPPRSLGGAASVLAIILLWIARSRRRM